VRRVDPAHLLGITARTRAMTAATEPAPTLLRPLAEYAAAVGETAYGEAT
jgi:hypothetical protein